jgi:hypothetical protein
MLILLSLDGVAHGQRRSGDRRGCGDEVRAAAERGSSGASGPPMPCAEDTWVRVLPRRPCVHVRAVSDDRVIVDGTLKVFREECDEHAAIQSPY